ncbi:UvrD/REP helicase [Candidatus Magnetomorum sp. HK-1]|nr:UvrD/REP helicase [Candidatus Magnetomorum sp. HK-1]
MILTEDNEKQIYYISRTNPSPIDNVAAKFVSYRAPVAKIASYLPGDIAEIDIRGELKQFEIIERIQYHPIYKNEWDSTNNTVDSHQDIRVTVESFKSFLNDFLKPKDIEKVNFIDDLLREEKKSKIIFEGIRRNVIECMSLRDQPILDEFQDEIFRISLKSQLLIVGPPGTGKTTTLIKRIGQKLDIAYLSDEERELIDKFPMTANDSWVL